MLIGTCTIVGDARGFSPHYREFIDAREAGDALHAAGIDRSRFDHLLARSRPNWTTSLEVTAIQAQQLGVLRVDKT